ncbi:unnamed protein product [Owenia fusiformis]|uniref:Uncharacterized protein n=1 Tax=Owenia fusiformis TaxID=6347 RepID=A0A8J1Y6L2_OWEFU|nr:unnamed protein product [Owenia fusiformis]
MNREYPSFCSLYFALSENSLEESIKPELREEFEREKNNWLPRTDTAEHRQLDRRKPGIFKLEAEGDQMTALCSKTYCLYDSQSDTVKFSCKGLNKNQFENPMELYKKVLDTNEAQSGVNIGFRMMQNRMHTYHQERLGFSNFYCKRKLNPDGSTEPLDITLTPSQ